MLPLFYRADGHLSPASGKWAPRRTRWHLECAGASHRPRERVTATLSMPAPLVGNTKEQYRLEHADTSRCSCGRSTALELAQKRPHKAAFAIDREEGAVRPYSRSSLYKADRYRARDGKDWFPGAQASPKYAPSRSCRTNGRTSARIC